MKPAAWIGIMLGLLYGLNLYFRYKLAGPLKQLMDAGVLMSFGQLMNRKRLEREVLSRYPEHRPLIEKVARLMKRSLLLALTVVLLMAGLYLVTV